MAQMLRKQIYIEKRQQTLLRRLAKKRGVSEAEVIRQAIDHEASGGPAPALPLDHDAWEQALAFMKALQAQGPLTDQRRTWKREDAYEERLSRYDQRTG